MAIRVKYEKQQLLGETKDTCLSMSKQYNVTIYNRKEKLFKELQPIIFQQLNEAAERTHLSGGAKDLLQQATSKHNEATSLATRNKWSEGYESLQLAQSLLRRI